MARRSVIALLGGRTVGTWWIVAAAVAIATIALGWGATRRRGPLLFATLFVIGVACQLQLNARLQSDGFYYYSYLRSLVFDRDVEFSNDYRMLGLGDKTHLFQKTRTGHAQSAWTIGPSILWAPFFAAAHPVAARLNATGADVSLDGVSYPYRQAVCIAGLVYGLLGCWFCYRLTALYFDRRLAAAATTCVVCGSFMLWYIVKEPSMTHAPSMALVAGFAWMWAATQGARTRRQWVLLGALAGLMTLVRWQNAMFALLPAYDAAIGILTARRTRDAQALRSSMVAALVFIAAAAAAFVPQMLVWRAIYGSFLAVSPVGPQIRFGDPQIVDILWSSRNGLLSMSPILYCAAIGLVIFAFRRADRLEPDADEHRPAPRPPPWRGGVFRRDRCRPGPRLPPVVRPPVHLSRQPVLRVAESGISGGLRSPRREPVSRRSAPAIRTR
ncbi:MAG: glycosyltransferase family 39 protein [Acidobacteria bacterium]|nr:glycosyltransferase family 39 protein [Acidobacteriota bacterium]